MNWKERELIETEKTSYKWKVYLDETTIDIIIIIIKVN